MSEPGGTLAEALAAAGDDYVLTSSHVYPMTKGSTPFAGYLRVSAGRIAAVGEGPAPESIEAPVVELGDRAVLPGFIDPHIHLALASATAYGAVPCYTEETPSLEAMVERLRERADLRDTRGGWLVGQSNLFTDRRLEDKRFPSRQDLDRVSTEFPVVVRCGAHITAANSRAIERIVENVRGKALTGDQVIDRDEDGPTGIVRELFHEFGVPDLTRHDLVAAIRATALEKCTMNGITSIGEIADTIESTEIIRELVSDGGIAQRVHAYVIAPWTMPFDDALTLTRTARSGRFTFAGIKLFGDGGFSAGGAATLKPYLPQFRSGDSANGRLGYSDQAMRDMLARVDADDLQLAVHTNGERAQLQLAMAREAVRPKHRVRFEHAGNFVTDWDQVQRWNGEHSAAVVQPAFIWLMSSFLPEFLGEDARAGRMAFRTLLDRGLELSGSSDGTGSEPRSFDPLGNIRMLGNRVSCLGEHLGEEENVDPIDGLVMYTRNASRAMETESEVGTLREGLRADLAIVDRDPVAGIGSARVEATIAQGAPVFVRDPRG